MIESVFFQNGVPHITADLIDRMYKHKPMQRRMFEKSIADGSIVVVEVSA